MEKAQRDDVMYEQTPVYNDFFWKWLRRFISIWIYLFVSYCIPIALEALVYSSLSNIYVYGIIGFWYFYLPVFGLFLHMFYTYFTGDGVWNFGNIATTYFTKTLKDLFIIWII